MPKKKDIIDSDDLLAFITTDQNKAQELWEGFFDSYNNGKNDSYFFTPGVLTSLEKLKDTVGDDVREAIFIAFNFGVYVGRTRSELQRMLK